MTQAAADLDILLWEPRIEDARWSERLPDLPDLVARALGAAGCVLEAGGVIDLLFTSDAEMRELNLRWRGLDKPTDVLSFPADGLGEPDRPPPLGDIALGFETAMRDAAALGRPVDAHIAHLVIHGFLHLLGHDHMTPTDAAVMEPLEARILADLGWPDPYASGPYGEAD